MDVLVQPVAEGGADALVRGASFRRELHGADIETDLLGRGTVVHCYADAFVAHYGHFVTDVLAQLWPLFRYSGVSIKLLLREPFLIGAPGQGDFVADILKGLGVAASDIVVLDRPMRFERLIVPGPAFGERAFAHRVFGHMCEHVGKPLWKRDTVDSTAVPAYLAKTRLTSGVAKIANEDVLVEELARRGMDIVFPETLAFADQVRTFSSRRIVIGSTGSAFHTSLFAARRRTIIGLNWAPHLNTNFVLTDRLTGARSRYYHAPGTQYGSRSGFHFDWTLENPADVAAELSDIAARVSDGITDESPKWKHL